jgi:ABC-type lipoprotein export system ATPase subunit
MCYDRSKEVKMEQDVRHPELIEEKQSTTLRVENVDKTYALPTGKLTVLRNVSLQVHQGEFIAITGASGSGKTTLLSLLGALDSPDSGEIWLDTIAVHRLRGVEAADFRRQQVGFVFQLFYLLPNLTALENVMAPLLPFRRKLDFDLKQRAMELLQSVGLGDRLGHPPARLSGGEQQRVAIARALINRPKLVLADEPTGNLDPATGGEVLHVLRDLQQTGSQTLILVTHDPELAALADRCIHLKQLQRTEA